LYAAGAVLRHSTEHAEDAVRICTNCLELNLQDVQMMRSVGYFLIKAGRSDLALAVLDRRELAPGEPQSFLDGALARTLCLRNGVHETVLQEAIELAATVVRCAWASRFDEVEWPALVLLHLLVETGETRGAKGLWPLDAELRCPDFEVGLLVWLGWDTDGTDIDLHVVEPSGNEVFYSNKRSAIGGHLSKDFQHGYGPEVYLIKNPVEGKYAVRAKYYASHQQSTLTGATSAVLWTIQGGTEGHVQFETIRLERSREKMDVVTITV